MKVIIGLLVILVLISLGTAGFFILQNQKLISNLTSSPSPTNETTTSRQTSPQVNSQPTSFPSPTPSSKYLQENIEASLNSQNYQALTTYMNEPTVNFTLMSSECCGPITKDEAISQLTYVNGGEPFSFDQTTPLVQSLKANNTQLADAFIGISQNSEQLVAFTIKNGKITAIQLSASYKLYN